MGLGLVGWIAVCVSNWLAGWLGLVEGGSRAQASGHTFPQALAFFLPSPLLRSIEKQLPGTAACAMLQAALLSREGRGRDADAALAALAAADARRAPEAQLMRAQLAASSGDAAATLEHLGVRGGRRGCCGAACCSLGMLLTTPPRTRAGRWLTACCPCAAPQAIQDAAWQARPAVLATKVALLEGLNQPQQVAATLATALEHWRKGAWGGWACCAAAAFAAGFWVSVFSLLLASPLGCLDPPNQNLHAVFRLPPCSARGPAAHRGAALDHHPPGGGAAGGGGAGGGGGAVPAAGGAGPLGAVGWGCGLLLPSRTAHSWRMHVGPCKLPAPLLPPVPRTLPSQYTCSPLLPQTPTCCPSGRALRRCATPRPRSSCGASWGAPPAPRRRSWMRWRTPT